MIWGTPISGNLHINSYLGVDFGHVFFGGGVQDCINVMFLLNDNYIVDNYHELRTIIL